jgi:membrane protease YdiL (CAAX protease family)
VEEIVFRFAIGGIARQRLGDFWGAYGSALVFAMAHGSGAWNQLSMPLGPLLLALCCEWLYVTTGRLKAAMALHAACNASGWIFATLDKRWLSWLEALYLRV